MTGNALYRLYLPGDDWGMVRLWHIVLPTSTEMLEHFGGNIYNGIYHNLILSIDIYSDLNIVEYVISEIIYLSLSIYIY